MRFFAQVRKTLSHKLISEQQGMFYHAFNSQCGCTTVSIHPSLSEAFPLSVSLCGRNHSRSQRLFDTHVCCENGEEEVFESGEVSVAGLFTTVRVEGTAFIYQHNLNTHTLSLFLSVTLFSPKRSTPRIF